jgi:hypothetical protein
MGALLKHTWQTTIKNDAGKAIIAGTPTDFLGAGFDVKETVGAGQTVEVDCGSIDKTKIVSIALISTQNATVDTNAADATGGQEIVLTANQGYAWNNKMATACPITQNITKIFAKNNGTAEAVFTASFILDLIA